MGRGDRLLQPWGGPIRRILGLCFVALLLATAPRCACDGVFLTPLPDAGSAPDAGGVALDGGSLDAGPPRDGGGPDSGIADGGEGEGEDGGIIVTLPDGGTTPPCLFPGRPTFPFTCEGDEDWCDPAGDVDAPENDVVATWSRFEGAELVVDVRFLGMPFWLYRSNLDFYLDPRTYLSSGAGRIPALFGDGFDPPQLDGAMRVSLGSGGQADVPPSYPPDAYVVEPTPEADSFDRCATVLFAPDAPFMEFRFPLDAASFIAYFMFTGRGFPDDPSGFFVDPDFLFPGTSPGVLGSAGGRPDDLPMFVSICTLTCEDVGGTLQ